MPIIRRIDLACPECYLARLWISIGLPSDDRDSTRPRDLIGNALREVASSDELPYTIFTDVLQLWRTAVGSLKRA